MKNDLDITMNFDYVKNCSVDELKNIIIDLTREVKTHRKSWQFLKNTCKNAIKIPENDDGINRLHHDGKTYTGISVDCYFKAIKLIEKVADLNLKD